jgi:hypothetical protein
MLSQCNTDTFELLFPSSSSIHLIILVICYQSLYFRYLIEDKTTVTKMNAEIDLNRARGPRLPIHPPVSIDRPSLHTSKPGPPYPRRSLGLDVLPSRPLSSNDIFHIVNQFKTHRPVSPLG